MHLSNLHQSDLHQRLLALRPSIAQAVQAVYDEWEQDDDGLNDLRGAGGICDEIAQAISSVLAEAGIEFTEGGQDGDDHAFVVAYDDHEAFLVDVDPGTYEIGGGYSWRKIPDVVFTPEMVEVAKTWRPEDLE